MGLQKWQWNQIFEAIEAAGLNPAEFDREAGTDESGLRHRPSGASFVLGGVAGNYSSRYVAGDAPVEERTGLSLQALLRQIEIWLGAVKRDVNTTDLWGQIERQAELLEAVSDRAFENTPFSSVERGEIAELLREWSESVTRAYSLSEAQTRRLQESVDHLTEAADRVGRKDWVLMVYGTLWNLALQMVLPTDATRDILISLVTGLLGHGPPELPGG